MGELLAVAVSYLLAWRLYQKTRDKMIGPKNGKTKNIGIIFG